MYHISNDKRSLQSAQWLYEALKALMAERVYTEIKITDVVKRAQIGRTTFYRCFETLDDVLRYKCDQAYSGCAEHLKLSLLNNTPPIISHAFFLPFFKYWYTHFEIVELLIHANREDILKRSFHKMVDDLRDEYPHVPIEHYNYFIEIRAAISIAILSEWVKTHRQLSPEALFDIFTMHLSLDQYLLSFI